MHRMHYRSQLILFKHIHCIKRCYTFEHRFIKNFKLDAHMSYFDDTYNAISLKCSHYDPYPLAFRAYRNLLSMMTESYIRPATVIKK